MSEISSIPFPSPVGGVALPSDLAPSIIFAVLYGLLLPLVFYRILNRRSRTLLLIGTIIFAVERVAIFSLRAAQSQNTGLRLTNGLAKYMQISFGLGFIGIANDLVNLIRCLLVNPTYGSERFPESSAAETKQCYLPEPQEGDEDSPRTRFWVRRWSDFTSLAFLAAIVPGIIAGSTYNKAFTKVGDVERTYRLRYASGAVALFLMIVIIAAALWSLKTQPRVGKRGVWVICLLASLAGVIATYRLSVMHNMTMALDSLAPGSLNSPGSKAAFYILHVLPEWVATGIMLSINIRKTFGTGMFGDWRNEDETPKEKVKREKSIAKRKAKKEGKTAEEPKAAPESEEPV